MPDATIGAGFLETANRLLSGEGEAEPSQTDLRRAVSTSYYAVFHSLAKACADALVGADRDNRSNNAWVEAYRGLDHGECYSACEGAANVAFPEPLKQFAAEFKQLQMARHRADYDPMARIDLVTAQAVAGIAEGCISALQEVGSIDMTAFATWVLITSKGAKNARKMVKDGTGKQILIHG